jgi:hypothetical protein
MNAKIQFKNMINTAKTKSWKKFSETDKPWELPYKISAGKIKLNKPISTLKKDDGTITKDPKETMSYLLEKLFPIDNIISETINQQNIRNSVNTPLNTSNDLKFTLEEIENIISELNPKKSPGWDKLTADIIQKNF